MNRMWLAASLALLLGLVAASSALAAGGPVQPVQGIAIGVPGSPYRYVTFGAGRDTSVERLAAGAVSDVRVLGRYGVPAVDPNGTTTGLSADGRTLILAEIDAYLPPRTTRLLVLAASPRLAIRSTLALPGWWTVDAISPDGRWLYLIQYTSSDVSKYAVRAYDLLARRMLAEAVVDPREHDEAMTGFPITRAMSADGRWAYTLYFRPSGVPFVHALDTVHRRAVCVDLPSLANADIGNGHLRLTPGGGTLQVDLDGMTGASIDTRTLVVTTAADHPASAPIRAVPRERPVTHTSGGLPWALIALLVAGLGTLAAAVAVGARPRRHPPVDPDLGEHGVLDEEKTQAIAS